MTRPAMRGGHFRVVMGGLLPIALVLSACSGGQEAPKGSDFSAKEYFSGKTIRVVTTSDPGGTTDLKARAVAANLGKFIPGNPRVQVTNQTPHVAGMNFLWNAPNDGTVIGLEASSTLEFELFRDAKWNAAKFRYLGSVDSKCKDILFLRGNAGYDAIEDVRGSDSPPLVTMGEAPDPASMEPMDLGVMLIAEYMDLPLEFKPVAKADTAELELGLQRGDINLARLGQDWCALPNKHPDWIPDKYLIPLLDVNPAGAQEQKELAVEKLGTAPPHVSEFLTDDQLAEWQAIVSSRRAGGNPVFLPPGTPDNVTEALRRAWSEASQDPGFQKAMLKAYGISGGLTWRSAAAYTKLVKENRTALYREKDKIDPLTERLYNKYTKQ